MEIERKKFQGALNILSFNRHFYVYGGILLAIIIISYILLKWHSTLFYFIVAAFTYGLIMPLIVSAYVYDFSKYYNFEWLEKLHLKDSKTTKIVNINAGFDETSFLLKKHFPRSTLNVFDFYNKKEHTEPAIVRARKVSLTYPNTKKIKIKKVPMEDKSVDVVFLLSAAHEIRSQEEKIIFLKECYRICKPNGSVIMIEHLRDLPNFLAFSIGFTHFFSKNTWSDAYKKAGFSTINDIKFTPFMSIFNSKP
ncbi:class I SAM-dependent methyltransferase [Lacinutrix undariae]